MDQQGDVPRTHQQVVSSPSQGTIPPLPSPPQQANTLNKAPNTNGNQDGPNSFLFSAATYQNNMAEATSVPKQSGKSDVSRGLDAKVEQQSQPDLAKIGSEQQNVQSKSRSERREKKPLVLFDNASNGVIEPPTTGPPNPDFDEDDEVFKQPQERCCQASSFGSCLSIYCCCRDPPEDTKNVLNDEDDMMVKGDRKHQRPIWRELYDCFVVRTVPLHPDGRFRTGWDIPMLLAVFYTILFVPFSVAWPTNYMPWIAFDVIVNILFILDVIFNFFTSYRNDEGDLEMSFRKCALHYLFGWFLIDLVASFPYDLILVFLPHTNVPTEVFRLLKLLRIFRIKILVRYIMAIGLSVTSTLFVLLCGFVLMCHWVGCLYFLIAVSEGLDNSWVAKQSSIQNLASAPQDVQYSASFYWAMVTTSTLGYGDITAYSYGEQIFATVSILLGALSYAVIIASVQQIVTWRFSSGAEYNRWMDNVVRYGDAHHLPPAIQKKLVGYYNYVWERRKTFDNTNIIQDLPFELRADVADYIHSRLFQANPVFCVSGMAFKHMLATKLGPGKVKLPDDVLFFEGEAVLDIVLIRRGALELVAGLDTADELIVSSRRDGQYCGDLGIFDSPQVHYVSVVVTDYSDIHQIPACDLLAILENFPKEKILFQRVAEARKVAIDTLLQKFRDHSLDWRESSRNRDLTGMFSPKNSGGHSTVNQRVQVAIEADLWKLWDESVSPEADDLICAKVIKLPMPASVYANFYGMETTPRASDRLQGGNDEPDTSGNQLEKKLLAQISSSQLASNAAADVLASLSAAEGFFQSPNLSKRRRNMLETPFFPSSQTTPGSPSLAIGQERLSPAVVASPQASASTLESLVDTLTVEIEELERKVAGLSHTRGRQRQHSLMMRSGSDPDPIVL